MMITYRPPMNGEFCVLIAQTLTCYKFSSSTLAADIPEVGVACMRTADIMKACCYGCLQQVEAVIGVNFKDLLRYFLCLQLGMYDFGFIMNDTTSIIVIDLSHLDIKLMLHQ